MPDKWAQAAEEYKKGGGAAPASGNLPPGGGADWQIWNANATAHGETAEPDAARL